MSILSTILRVESGGRNIPQGIHDINTVKGTPAQGYLQIIDPTWAAHGGAATGYKSAIDAPWDVQRSVAMNIPIGQWGPNTQAALKAAGYSYSGKETLGDVMKRYGEDPNATTPESTGKERAQQQGPTKSGAPLTGQGALPTATPAAPLPAPTPVDTASNQKRGSLADMLGAFGAAQRAPQVSANPYQLPQAPASYPAGPMPMIAPSVADQNGRNMLAQLMQQYWIT